MHIFDVQTRGQRVEVSRRVAGRIAAAGGRFLKTLPWTAGAFAILFGIDWIVRNAAEAQMFDFYWASVVVMAVFISFVLGISRILRIETWIVDASEEIVAYEHRQVWGNPAGVEVALSNLRTVDVTRAGVGRSSKVELRFDDGVEVLCSTWLGHHAIEPVVGALREALEDTGVEWTE